MNETQFRRSVATVLRKRGCQVTPIENMVGVGCPDLHIAHFGKEYWVETKGPASITKDYAKLRKTQYAWMTQRSKAMLDSFVVGYRDGRLFLWSFDSSKVEPLDAVYVKLLKNSSTKRFDTLDELIYTLLSY